MEVPSLLNRIPWKKIPWFSLAILFAAHVAFGWFLASPEAIAAPEVAKFAWAFVLCFDLIILGTLTASPNTYRAKFMRWTSSNEGRLFSVILIAFFTAMFLVLVRLFGYMLVLSLSLSLARLDMLAAGFSDLPVLVLLLFMSLVGFGAGWQANHRLKPLVYDYLNLPGRHHYRHPAPAPEQHPPSTDPKPHSSQPHE